jgi:hypothetical protein
MLLLRRAVVLLLLRKGGRTAAMPLKLGAGSDFFPSKLAGK